MVQQLAPLPPATTPLASGLGLVLTEDVIAPIDLPPFTNSAMDGFAVRSSATTSATPELPVTLTILGGLEAGEAWNEPIGQYETVRIGTGAAVPQGLDAVIPAEHVNERDGDISVIRPIEAGRNVRVRGEDLQAGTTAVRAGTQLRAQEIGLLAALGIESVLAIPSPKVSIVSLGRELVSGARPVPLYDVNSPLLSAQATGAGAKVVAVDRSDGDPGHLAELFARLGESSDLIVTSGGISDSHADTMAQELESHPNGELWHVRLRPGKHFGVGHFDGYTILSLPGNPIAAFVGFELFGRLAIDVLAGMGSDRAPRMARVTERVSGSIGRTDAIRGFARIDGSGQVWVTPTTNRGSGAIATLPESSCLILLPESVESVAAGDPVEIRWVGYE